MKHPSLIIGTAAAPAHLWGAGMLRLITLLVVAAALFACGGEDDATSTASAPKATATAAPVDLIGTTWETSLEKGELEDPPGELRADTSQWAMSFKATGGKDGGPSVEIVNDEVGEIVNPISISGDVLKLEIPVECPDFAFAVDGDELTLTPTDTCPADSITSVLTTKPWKRSDA